MDLYTQTYNDIPKGWEELFTIAEPEVRQISDLLEQEKGKGHKIVPEQSNIFRIFHMCRPENIKVIITALDPYPQIKSNGVPKAQGFSFSVHKDDPDIPGSLQNIYKEILNSYPHSIIPNNGDISNWVTQGVFLLNIALTCRAGESNSHAKYRIWMPFIDRLMKYLANTNKNIIFLLWGNDAQKLQPDIEKAFKNILTTSHPSGNSSFRGFLGCGHFLKANQLLKSFGSKEIEWLPQKNIREREPEIWNEITKIVLETNKETLEFLSTHYKDYYKEPYSSVVSLEEFSIYQYTFSKFNTEKVEGKYIDFLKKRNY